MIKAPLIRKPEATVAGMAKTPCPPPRRPNAQFVHGILQRKEDERTRKPGGCRCEGCAGKAMSWLQRKLAIGSAHDPLEHEADRVADQVVAMSAPIGIRRSPIRLQRAASPPSPASVEHVPDSVQRTLSGAGSALNEGVRQDMEQRFGHDFSRVRIHRGAAAAQSAQDVGALAYTVGSQIVFGSGRFAPETTGGKRLLAHELAHVVQQRPSGENGPRVSRAAGGPVASGSVASSSNAPQRLMRKVSVVDPGTNIPNSDGKGLVQTNAKTVQGYLRRLCAAGAISVNASSGEASFGAVNFCPKPLPEGAPGPVPKAKSDKSATPNGCNCLCDLIRSPTTYTIAIKDTGVPNTTGADVTVPSPNNSKFWGAALASGKTQVSDLWLVLGHELCGHAWLAEKGLPDENANRGEGGHQEAVDRENLLRGEHGLKARGHFKDPYCGESFSQDKKGPGPIEWSKYFKICEAWRQKHYGNKYKISDKIP